MDKPDPPLMWDGTQLTEEDWCDKCQSYLVCDKCANEPLTIMLHPRFVKGNRQTRRAAKRMWLRAGNAL